MVQILSTISSAVVALAGFALAIWIYRRFMPVMEIILSPRWADEAARILHIRLEVHNKSKIGLKRNPADRKQTARFQILEHNIPEKGLLSEWVPFSKEYILPGEEPLEWREPLEILKTTEKIEPGEMVSVELMYRFNSPVALHCGFQFRAELNRIAACAYGKKTDSWTTTTWIIPARNSKSKPEP